MSVIAAIKENGVIYMGADSQTTFGKRKKNLTQEPTFKIKKLRSGMLVGICGNVSAKQCIGEDERIFDIVGDALTKKEIVNGIIPKIKEKLEYWIGSSKCEEMAISIMLAYKDKLFVIEDDYSVLGIEGFYATGAGSRYALASLSDSSCLSVKERLLSGLKTSARFCSSVSGPFLLIDTQTLKYEIVEENE